MKVGLSLSRCVRDIFEGRVGIHDVLVVIARTDVDPHNDDHWQNIWDGYLYGGYSHAEWAGLEEHEQEMRDVLIDLHSSGKLHQPRQFGMHPARMPYYWLECIVPDDEVEDKPAVKAAWEQYKLIAGLSSKRQHRIHDEF
jgi:hypothetical protein